MNELIKINTNDEFLTVSGRELHLALKVDTPYHIWFPRMCEYGFVEDKDFCTKMFKSTGGRPMRDHTISIGMAKELCMIQRNALGKQFRQYFVGVEEKWNCPDAIMARALQFAHQRISDIEKENDKLLNTVALQSQQIAEMKPKVSYYDVVLNCGDLMPMRAIAKDYGKSAQWMNNFLHKAGIQFKQSDIWLLYQEYATEGYTSTKTHNYLGSDGETHSCVHTYWTQKGRLFIYDLMKQNGIYPLIEQEKNYEQDI